VETGIEIWMTCVVNVEREGVKVEVLDSREAIRGGLKRLSDPKLWYHDREEIKKREQMNSCIEVWILQSSVYKSMGYYSVTVNGNSQSSTNFSN
jgi:hypothetical protein